MKIDRKNPKLTVLTKNENITLFTKSMKGQIYEIKILS